MQELIVRLVALLKRDETAEVVGDELLAQLEEGQGEDDFIQEM